MLKLREATTTELGRWYSALETDFDRREMLPLGSHTLFIGEAVSMGVDEKLMDQIY